MSTARNVGPASSHPTGSGAPTAAVTFPPLGAPIQPPGEEMPTTTGQANWTTTKSNQEVADELTEITNGTVFNIPNNYRENRS